MSPDGSITLGPFNKQKGQTMPFLLCLINMDSVVLWFYHLQDETLLFGGNWRPINIALGYANGRTAMLFFGVLMPLEQTLIAFSLFPQLQTTLS